MGNNKFASAVTNKDNKKMFTMENPHFVRVMSLDRSAGMLSAYFCVSSAQSAEFFVKMMHFSEISKKEKKKKKKMSPSFLATFQSGLSPETKILFFLPD